MKDPLNFSKIIFVTFAIIILASVFWLAANNEFLALGISIIAVIFAISTVNHIMGISLITTGIFIFIFIFDKLEMSSGILLVTRLLGLYIIVMYSRTHKIKWADVFNFGFWINLIFAGILLLGCAYSSDVDYGIIKVIRFLAFNVFLFAIPFLINDKWENFYKILYYTAMLGSVLGFVAFVYLLTHGLGAEERVSLIGKMNVIWFGRLLGISILSAVGTYFIHRDKIVTPYIMSIAIPAMFFGLAISGSRMPVIALIISGGLFFLIHFQKSLGTKILFLCISVLLGVIVLYLMTPSIRILKNPFNVTTDLSNIHRVLAWEKSFELIVKAPIIGIGTGGFKTIGTELFTWLEGYNYPHNLFLEIFSENGVLGIVFLLIFLMWIFQKFRFTIIKLPVGKMRTTVVAYFSLFIYALINSQVSGNITMNEMVWFFGGTLVALSQINSGTIDEKI